MEPLFRSYWSIPLRIATESRFMLVYLRCATFTDTGTRLVCFLNLLLGNFSLATKLLNRNLPA